MTAEVAPSRLRQVTDHTLTRFVLVGLVNTVIDLGLFRVFEPHVGITWANVISTSAGMTFSFLVNGRFTFRNRRPTRAQALRFVASTGTVLYVIQPLIIHALLGLIRAHVHHGDPVLLAKLGAICVILVLNFLSYRFIVWPERRHDPDGTAEPAVRSGRRP